MGSNSKEHRQDQPALDKGRGSKATLLFLLPPQILPFVRPLLVSAGSHFKLLMVQSSS